MKSNSAWRTSRISRPSFAMAHLRFRNAAPCCRDPIATRLYSWQQTCRNKRSKKDGIVLRKQFVVVGTDSVSCEKLLIYIDDLRFFNCRLNIACQCDCLQSAVK